MTLNLNFKEILESQEKFSQNFYDKNLLNSKDKEEILKTLCLGLQQETSQIVSSTNFKVYNKENYELNKGNLLFGIVDSMRYLFALSNLYDITPEEIVSSYQQKDIFLNKQLELKDRKYSGQNVIVVDIDDIICDFRGYFNNWLEVNYSIKIDPNSTSYYTTKEVKEIGLSPEVVFETFLDKDEMLNIPLLPGAKEFLDYTNSKNIYIQLLTSRPEGHLKCRYQTYAWLEKNNVYYDSISFAPEKYIWLSKKDYYLENKVIFAIDDSPKHSLEYASHGVDVVVPDLPYNKGAVDDRIKRFIREDFFCELKKLIWNLFV